MSDVEIDEERLLSHNSAMELFKDSLAEIIVGDPILNDLHTAVTLEELNSYISLEHGQSITVNVERGDGIIMPIVVLQNSTVLDVKKAIQRYIILKQTRENHTQHISWKHVWKTYWLVFKNQKLSEDNKLIKNYEISNRDTLKFMKKLRQH